VKEDAGKMALESMISAAGIEDIAAKIRAYRVDPWHASAPVRSGLA
jgi:hypothetical protein